MIPSRWYLSLAYYFLVTVSMNAQWQYMGSPETGSPRNFVADGDTIFVCTNTGLFYSADNALSWHSIPTPLELTYPLEVLAENGTLYLIATDWFSYHKSLLFRSDDMGETWIDITSFSENNGIYINEFAHGDTLLIVRYDTLALSFDKGSTYNVFQSPVNPEHIFYFGGRILAVDNSTLLESLDFGMSWDTLYQTDTSHLTDVSVIDSHLWKSENLNFDDHVEISRSDDGGETWIPVFNNNASGIQVPSVIGSNGKLFITDRSSSTRFYFSDNNGLDWFPKEFDESKWNVFYHQGVLMSGDFQMMLKSYDDGNSFSSTQNGFKAASVHGFALHGDDIWVNANEASFKKSGSDWNIISGVRNVGSTRSGHFLGYVNDVPKRSTDGGMTWITIPPDVLGHPSYYLIHRLIVAGDNMYITRSFDIWHSTDNGVNWDEQSQSKDVIDFNEKYLAATRFSGEVQISDDGVAWQDITFGLETGGIYGVNALHYHNGTIFAALRDGLYRLPVFQKNWERLQWPVVNPDDAFFPQITFESYNNILIAGVEGQGVFISGNNGIAWLPVNEGLKDFLVLSSTVIEDEIYIGVEGGVWKRPLSEFIISDVSDPKKELAFSVSPVPSNDFIHIAIDDPEIKGEIHLSLFDTKGSMIKSEVFIFDANIRLDVRDIPPGVYFLHILVDHHWETIKVIKI